ncbi:MAG: serpin family protein [Porticoccaceae bacterium]
MKRLCAVLALTAALTGCSTPENPVVEQESREVTAAAGIDVNRFGVDLYRALREREEGNLIVSPLSVALALGMVLPGADDEAGGELLRALHAGDSDVANRDLSILRKTLEERGDAEGVTLTIANRGFADESFTLDATYVEALSQDHGVDIARVDYGQPEAARSTINRWVAERTNDLIAELLPMGSINADTRLTLVNAIYLLADWQHAFDVGLTRERPFNLADGSVVEVATMEATLTVPVVTGDDYQALELPYKGDALAMLIVVPNDLAAFEATLSSDKLADIVADLVSRPVQLSLPKVEARFSASLVAPLQAVGVRRIFCSQCNALPGIAPPAALSVSDVVHETYLRMDEKGTEAAAATGVVVTLTSAPLPSLTVNVDRPYFTVLRDRHTGSILFLGRVMDPR